MNTEHIKGTVKQIKGRVKEEVGHKTGNDSLVGEGVIDRVKGKLQKGYGDLKDSVKRGVDNMLDGDKRKKAM